MMNKILLLLLINSPLIFAGEQDGTGTPTTSNATSANEKVYNLVCAPVTDQNGDGHCILVEVATEE